MQDGLARKDVQASAVSGVGLCQPALAEVDERLYPECRVGDARVPVNGGPQNFARALERLEQAHYTYPQARTAEGEDLLLRAYLVTGRSALIGNQVMGCIILTLALPDAAILINQLLLYTARTLASLYYMHLVDEL